MNLDTFNVVLLVLTGAIIIGAIVVGAFVGGKVFRMAQDGPDSMSVVLLLSFLSLVAIIGYIAIQQSDLITLAATGVGALAGAVTAIYRGPSDGGKRE